jgi:hypothetical protein
LSAPPSAPTTPQADNESAATFAWLTRAIDSKLVRQAWRETRDDMRRPVDQRIIAGAYWYSDPWLVKGATPSAVVAVAPTWNPPDALDEWPTFDVERVVEAIGIAAQRTRHEALGKVLDATVQVDSGDAAAAVGRFYQMEDEIERHGDARMVQGEHLRAWLTTAVGPLLRGGLLTPRVADEDLAWVTANRLALPFQFELPTEWTAMNRYEEKHLDVLYNLKMAEAAPAPFDPAGVRVGQGEPWRESWGWLSRDIGFEEMHESVQLTARVMRRVAVVEGLMRALRSEHGELATVALAVVRRWLLALQAMTWLEAAAVGAWKEVRPQDLACFAFGSVRPDWPRRVVAVSHRSADVKPALVTMRAWRSSRFAIDASYVPAWETNNGMVWALFGATPAIARVHSPGYDESVWCRREAELMEYLIEHADFLSDRFVLDLEQSAVRSLDNAYTVWDVGDMPEPGIAPAFSEFPPLSQVWTPWGMPDWEVKMFRASAALRAMNVLLGPDPEVTNQVVAVFLRGKHDLPSPVPTNNPGGWGEYAAVFLDLQAALGSDASEPAVRLPSDYGAEVLYDGELLDRVPDLSSGEPALGDVLVALEFLRTEWPILVDQSGRLLALNCRGLSRETFAGDEQLSLHRGLLAIRLPVPLWVIQTAGQAVETWGLPGDPPIFTEHTPNQFSWMMEIFVERSVMQARYAQDSGLELSTALQRLCREGR